MPSFLVSISSLILSLPTSCLSWVGTGGQMWSWSFERTSLFEYECLVIMFSFILSLPAPCLSWAEMCSQVWNWLVERTCLFEYETPIVWDSVSRRGQKLFYSIHCLMLCSHLVPPWEDLFLHSLHYLFVRFNHFRNFLFIGLMGVFNYSFKCLTFLLKLCLHVWLLCIIPYSPAHNFAVP